MVWKATVMSGKIDLQGVRNPPVCGEGMLAMPPEHCMQWNLETRSQILIIKMMLNTWNSV